MTDTPTRTTVLHRGVPIGVGDLKADDFMARGDFDALAAYEALRPIVREAQRAADNFGFLPPDGGVVGGIDAAGEAAGDAADALYARVADELELRDIAGALIPCDWIELWDADRGFSLMAGVRTSSAPVHAVREQPTQGNDARA